MLIVLSPAKSLDLDSPPTTLDRTTPRFIDDAADLIKILKPKSPAEVGALMAISDPLSVLNVTRYADWHPDHGAARQAIMSFDGDVYTGLAARTLAPEALAYVQRRVRILSGLYGVLRRRRWPVSRRAASRIASASSGRRTRQARPASSVSGARRATRRYR